MLLQRRCLPRIVTALTVGLIVASLSCGKEQAAKDKTDDLARRLEKLRSVPYTSLTSGEVDTTKSGVVRYDSLKTAGGYTLICRRLALGAYLMDMKGDTVHAWTYPEDRPKFWMRAELLANGDIIVIHKLRSIMRLDWNSNLVWHLRIPAHHDFVLAPDSSIYLYAFGGRPHRGLPTLFESIVHLTPEGKEIDRWSTYDHLDYLKNTLDTRSFLDTALDSMEAAGIPLDSIETYLDGRGVRKSLKKTLVMDYFHANTLTLIQDTPLGRKDERFKAGNLLVCFRNINQLAIMDPATMEIVWSWGEGILERPHDPTMLDNGHILVFDNGALREYTLVLEIDPLTEDIAWQYGSAPHERFYSPTRGSAQRLPNGNTLICDADNGRGIEVTPKGEIVWEWLNPDIRDGHRAQVYRLKRYPAEMVDRLVSSLGANQGRVGGDGRSAVE